MLYTPHNADEPVFPWCSNGDSHAHSRTFAHILTVVFQTGTTPTNEYVVHDAILHFSLHVGSIQHNSHKMKSM